MQEMHTVPQALTERFLPHEQPRIELIRERGNVRLWRTSLLIEGHPIGRVRYHVSKGESLPFSEMPSLSDAELNFEFAAHRAGQ